MSWQSQPPKKSAAKQESEAGVARFFADMRLFFYAKVLTYVDVGAYGGDVFRAALKSGLNITEAHLIEPNPNSYQYLQNSAREYFKGRGLNLYNTALGSRAGKVGIRLAQDMTKVVSPSDSLAEGAREAGANTVEVECTTLDQLAERFTDHRISLLKLDVEGSELEVIDGAKKLLEGQRIDVIYVEAGMNPAGTQQCYYRDIEDALGRYGYRLFRIYEQKHEWMDDSPFLRRTNLAFLSPRFADEHPFRLTRELVDAKDALRQEKETCHKLEADLARAREEIANLRDKNR